MSASAPNSPRTRAATLCHRFHEDGELDRDEVAELVAATEGLLRQLQWARDVMERCLTAWGPLRDELNSLWGMIHPWEPARDPFDKKYPRAERTNKV